MTNIRNEVWQLIERDPSIKLDLERGLINMRALARFCRDSGIEGSEDAILSAIRRYPKGQKSRKQYEKAIKIVEGSAITIRSHVASIALSKSKETHELLSAVFKIIRYEKSEICRVVEAEESIHLMVDKKNLDKIITIFPSRLVLETRKHLAEINLHLNPKTLETPGVLSIIANELTRNEINLYEVMSCVPELLLFVDEENAVKAHQVLFDLAKSK
ncbi:hypothetical protein J4450_03250 [Candidatus Micrarchaeota archaeon]|nr:hypothetical protein [Candidatus Micrarchaeota archaeon]